MAAMAATGNLPVAFAALLGGGLLLEHGITTVKTAFGGSSSTPTSSGAQAPGGVGQATPQRLSQAAAPYGWSAAELADWVKLIEKESGGNPAAVNASSGAFGIGQFLGATKSQYAAQGATSSDPLAQLTAMAAYIHDRYGSPSAAWAHEQANNWY